MRKNIAVLLLTIVFVLALAGSALAWTQKDVDEIKDKGRPLDFTKGVSENPENTTYLPNPYDKLPEVWARDPNQPDKEELYVLVNGNPVRFPDQEPYIDKNGRTLVPVRFVAEKLGSQVDWDEKSALVTINRKGTEIKLKIGESKAVVNGETKTFDTRAVLTDKGRTMVPLRFISETLGAKVEWEPGMGSVIGWVRVELDDYDVPQQVSVSRNPAAIIPLGPSEEDLAGQK